MALSVLNGGGESRGDWEYLIANLLKFYQGGLSYQDCMSMSFHSLIRFNRYAQKINAEIENNA